MAVNILMDGKKKNEPIMVRSGDNYLNMNLTFFACIFFLGFFCFFKIENHSVNTIA